MSTTTSKGYKKPDTGDRMPSWCSDLEDNITRVNSHIHDGSDSEQIPPKYILKPTATLSSGSWSAVVGQAGTYKQTVSLPSGYTMTSVEIKFLDPNGHPLMLSVEKVSSTSFDVFINDNSINVTAVYG